MSRNLAGNDSQCGPHHDQLSVLGEELLVQVFEALGSISTSDLCNVSRLNKMYHRLADLVLYRRIQFNTPEFHLVFSESLDRRPRRGSAIQAITLTYPSSELSRLILQQAPGYGSHHAPSRIDTLSLSLSTMSNLATLDVSVPDTLLHGIGTLFNGPFDLACLKSCTLFYQCKDDQYWDLHENIHIFAHPVLESLVIKRAKLDIRGFDSIERPHQTALKKLHLIECDINDDALSDILEFPDGLVEFAMTQTPEPHPELEESSDNIGDYITALKSQGHSLETITIDFQALTGLKSLRMRDFETLKRLCINWDYQLFGKSSTKPRMHSVGLPPNMETLEFFNELGTDSGVTELLVSAIESRDVLSRRWQMMVVVANDDGEVPRDIVEACKLKGLQLDIIGHFDSDAETEPECESGMDRNEAKNGVDMVSEESRFDLIHRESPK